MTPPGALQVKRAGVVGWPVSHSLSPLIHAIWAQREGANALYEAIAVEPNDAAFRQRINELRIAGYKGVNVTIPHKVRALEIADRASDAARAIGAANMLSFSTEGIIADNSDALAVHKIVRGLAPAPSTTLVLGAGGAARAVLWALRRANLGPIALANRTRARAEAIAKIADAAIIDWSSRNDALAQARLIINTTSLGMTSEPPLDLDFNAISPNAVVFDAVYAPLETTLLKAAKARGARTIDGLVMLMEQAAPAYRAWLGEKAEIDDDLRARLIEALKARGRT